jgi:hypothetical protein
VQLLPVRGRLLQQEWTTLMPESALDLERAVLRPFVRAAWRVACRVQVRMQQCH